VRVVARSGVYETPPEGGVARHPFLNAALAIETTLTARELMDVCRAIEDDAGRTRERRFADRTLDIDLLLFGNEALAEPDLVVPHPRLAERAFALVPLADIAPGATIPGADRTVREALDALPKPDFEPVPWIDGEGLTPDPHHSHR
jgi:2-amino-4-hydroxy-6-hydroxymethyldihydropteridine diphosphokinase